MIQKQKTESAYSKQAISAELIAVAKILLGNRKMHEDDYCDGGVDCRHCFLPLVARLDHFMTQGTPIEMILPGYPFKMPNPEKTFGMPFPDRAEELSLLHLHTLCGRIQEQYAPGARIVLASDGRPILPIWQLWWPNLSLERSAQYDQALDGLRQEMGAASTLVRYRTLEETYPGMDYLLQLRKFHQEYLPDLNEIRQALEQRDPITTRAFGGNMKYFVRDGEASPLGERLTNTERAKWARGAALRAVQNSVALSTLLRDRFPHAIRLSVHPQTPHGNPEIGFYLTPNRTEAWRTPWHTVALWEEETRTWKFPENVQAKRAGATLVLKNQRPSHYTLATGRLADSER